MAIIVSKKLKLKLWKMTDVIVVVVVVEEGARVLNKSRALKLYELPQISLPGRQ
jgi:hypothetical protein